MEPDQGSDERNLLRSACGMEYDEKVSSIAQEVKMARNFLYALVAALVATPSLADTVSDKVLAFDRVAQIIVLEDKTVWSLKDLGAEIPEGLKAGDTITIDYSSPGDDGIGQVNAITIAQ